MIEKSKRTVTVSEDAYNRFVQLCEDYGRIQQEQFNIVLDFFLAVPIEFQCSLPSGLTDPLERAPSGKLISQISKDNPFLKFAERGTPSPVAFTSPEELKQFSEVFGYDQPLRGTITLKTPDGIDVQVSAEEYRIQERSSGNKTIYAIPKVRNDGTVEFEPSTFRKPRSRQEEELYKRRGWPV